MLKYEGFSKAGSFTLATGMEVQGQLRLRGTETILDLYSGNFFDTHESADIFGLFYDRSKVSLIDCITKSGPGFGIRDDEPYHFSSVFPHFVIFGDQHIRSSDRTISELTFTVDDAATLFFDRNAFGSVVNARSHMERIVEEQQRGTPIEIGDYPHLFYFTGKHEIFLVNTVLGEISATHSIVYRLPGPKGIHVDNTIRLRIAFASVKTVEESIEGVIDIVRFLEVIAGRPQNISELALVPVSTGEHSGTLDVYWCMIPHRGYDDESRKPHPADLPIKAAMKPDEFTSVFSRWLERHDEWRNARDRFSTSFTCQNTYNIDRIVGAANMFDILPSSACQETVTLPPDLAEARDNARKAFGALPVSPERDSILNALGRISKATLKRKVRSRAKLISDIVGDEFPELDLIVAQAVDCRNYYVHGTKTKIDYSNTHALVPFFTDTLEFVFAASDLVDSGWDINAWTKQGMAQSHPFGQYRLNYARQLSELKKLL